MTFQVRKGITLTLVKALLGLVFMSAAILISEYSARQLEAGLTVSPSTQADHLRKPY